MNGYIERQTLQDIADAIREKNGSSDTYKPNEMAEAIRGIEGGGEGFDLVNLGASEGYANEVNSELYLQIKEGWNEVLSGTIRKKILLNESYAVSASTKLTGCFIYSLPQKYIGSTKGVFSTCIIYKIPPILDMTEVKTSLGSLMKNVNIITVTESITLLLGDKINNSELQCVDILGMQDILYYNYINKIIIKGNKATTLSNVYGNYYSVKEIEYLDSENLWLLRNLLYNGLLKLRLGSIEKVTNLTTIGSSNSITECTFRKWKRLNISLVNSVNLSIESIKYNIFHAINSADGATNRILSLHETPFTEWNDNISNTTPTADDAEFLEVEDWDRYKKEDGTLYTWGEIASEIKDITIA